MATVQKGEALKIGFNGYVYTGYIMEDVAVESTGEITPLKDEDNATCTKLISDLGKAINFTALIKSAGAIVPPAKGSAIAINTVTYMVEDASVKFSRGVSQLTCKAIKEDSMTYTA